MWRDELFLSRTAVAPSAVPIRSATTERRAALRCRQLLLCWPWKARMISSDWRPWFQQFHDILPGTSIPEVFEQAELVWRRPGRPPGARPAAGKAAASEATSGDMELGGCSPWRPGRSVRLQRPRSADCSLPRKTRPLVAGRSHRVSTGFALYRPVNQVCHLLLTVASVGHASRGVSLAREWSDRSRCSAGLLALRDAMTGISCHPPAPRYRDRGEFWDAWDLAADTDLSPGRGCGDSWNA